MEKKDFELIVLNTIKEIDNLEAAVERLKTGDVEKIMAGVERTTKLFSFHLEAVNKIKSLKVRNIKNVIKKYKTIFFLNRKGNKLLSEFSDYVDLFENNADCLLIKEMRSEIAQKQTLLKDICKVYFGRMELLELLRLYGKDLDGDIIGGVFVSVEK